MTRYEHFLSFEMRHLRPPLYSEQYNQLKMLKG